MKKKILIFLVSFLSIHLVLCTMYYYLIYIKTELYEVDKLNLDTDIWFVGDSHMKRAIRDGVIPKAQNLSFYGESIRNTYFRLSEYINTGHQPKLVLLQAESTRWSNFGLNYQKNSTFYARKLDFQDYLFLFVNDLNASKQYLSSFLFPYINILSDYKMLKHKDTRKNKDTKEFIALQMDERASKALKDFNEIYPNKNPQDFIDPVVLDYTYKIIHLLSTHNIDFFFIEIPISDFFNNCFLNSKVTKNQILEKALMDLHIDSHKLIQLDLPSSSDHSCFFDSHHLNFKGSDGFTNELLCKLDALNLIGN
jgi:hypothetical protein